MNEENTTQTVPNLLFTVDDPSTVLMLIIICASIAMLVNYLINFVPSFMASLVRRIKNPSIIYSDDTLHEPTLHDPDLTDTKLESTLSSSKFIDDAAASIFGKKA